MQFNQILNPRFSSLLTRYFAIRGAGSPAPTLAPEIAPSIDVNQMDDAAMFFTRNEKLAAVAVGTIAAAAGNYSRLLLRNPSNSGTLIIVDSILANSSAAIYGLITATTVDDAAAAISYLRDYRWVQSTGVVSPVGVVSSGNASPVAPNGGNGRVFVSPAAASAWQPFTLLLPPGAAFYLYVATVNTALTLSGFTWRERALPGEEVANG